MRRLLVRLYPAAWRRRFGDEFEALLEERALGPFDVADVLLGALDAHLLRRGLRATSGNRKGFTMSLRLGGSAAILGALLWVFGFGAGLLGQSMLSLPGASMILAGNVAMLLALIGLSAFQARRHPGLVWAAFAIPAIGNLLSIFGLIGMGLIGDEPVLAGMTPWGIWSVGLFGMFGGSALFAAATWLTGALSRRASLGLGVGGVASVVVMSLGYLGALPDDFGFLMIPVLLAFLAGWFWLGIDALRRSRPAVSIAPA